MEQNLLEGFVVASKHAEALGEYFQQKSVIHDETPFTFTTSIHVSVLDDPITDTEIHEASKRLKKDKAAADGWSSTHVTSIAGTLFTILSFLMNFILKNCIPHSMENHDCISHFQKQGK